jgi:mRNA interferase RelE/StbE
MKVEFKRSFLKELQKLRDKTLKNHIIETITEVESAKNSTQIKNLKKLSGYDMYYRIKIGTYRIGIKIEKEVVYFVVFEHRKDIYRGFP